MIGQFINLKEERNFFINFFKNCIFFFDLNHKLIKMEDLLNLSS